MEKTHLTIKNTQVLQNSCLEIEIIQKRISFKVEFETMTEIESEMFSLF